MKKATSRICANEQCARAFWDHRDNVKYCSPECRALIERARFYSHLSKYPGTVNALRIQKEAKLGLHSNGSFSRKGGFARKGIRPVIASKKDFQT
jgi:hypothetical protein